MEKHYVLTLPGGSSPKYPKDFPYLNYVNVQAPKGGILRLKTHIRGETLNPFKGVLSPVSDLSITFATLLSSPIDDLQNAYGYVAESFEIGDTHVTFHLRKNATFQDGSPISPEDIIFSFDFFSKEANPTYETKYQNISRGEKIGPHSVRFYFKGENPIIAIENLGKMPILSHKDHALCRRERLSTPLLASGPYHIRDFQPGETIHYHRTPNWWGENLPINKGLYNFEGIQYHYYANPITTFEAFKKGDYDLRIETRASFWAQNYDFEAITLGTVLKKTFKKGEVHGFNAMFINTRRPYLKNQKVRLALNILLDFKKMNKILFHDTYKRNTSVFMNTGFGGDHPVTPDEKNLAQQLGIPSPNLVDPAQFLDPKGTIYQHKKMALKLLRQAGWIIRKGKLIHHKTKKPFELEIITPHPGQARLLEQYAKTLKDIGIKAHIRLLPMPTYLKRAHHFDYDIILESLPPMVTPGLEMKNFWGSVSAVTPGNYNFSGIKDPHVDGLIDKILKEKNPKTLHILTRLLDRVLFKGAYFIPMWYPDQIFVAFWNKFDYPPITHKTGFTHHTWWIKQ